MEEPQVNILLRGRVHGKAADEINSINMLRYRKNLRHPGD